MNKRERFAGAILVITLAVGILVSTIDKLGDRRDQAACQVATAEGDTPRDTSGASQAAAGVEPASVMPGNYRRLDLNTASAEELELLPGIGPKKAEAVLAWRDTNGRFSRVEDLLEIKGIGERTLERLRPYVCVDR